MVDLVGRDLELSRCEDALGRVAAGRGEVVLVVGEMGVGKTRLAEEALAAARRQGHHVLIGRTPPAGSGLAFAPLLSAFGPHLRSLDLRARTRLVADLLHLGRLWPDLRLPPPPAVHDQALERALLYEAVARLLERMAAEAPVTLFVDDLHWADAPSLGLLGYLVPGLADLPVALIGAYRPEGVSENDGLRSFVTTARRSGLVSEVSLAGLGADDVAALVAGVLGSAPPRALLDVTARAAGTPLFVQVLIQGLVDGGALTRTPDGSGWTFAAGRYLPLPPSLHDLVVDRLAHVPPDDRATLELIAHGPQGLPHDLLEDAGELGPRELVATIRHLVDAGLVVQDDSGPATGRPPAGAGGHADRPGNPNAGDLGGGRVVYRLAHPLVQEVVAAAVPAIVGRRLHARLARTTGALRPTDVDRLAFHYSRATGLVDAEGALDVLLLAGDRAHDLAAHDEAARYFGTALTLVRGGERPEMLAGVLERLGRSWELLGETAAAMEVWGEAVAEMERTGDARGVARVRRLLAFAAQAGGDMTGAGRHLDAGVAALRDLPPSEELADLHASRLLIDTPLNEPDRAHDALAELKGLAAVLSSPRVTTVALLAEASLLWVGGVTGESPMPKVAEALRVAEEAEEWALARRAHREAGWLALLVYDHPTVRRHAEAQVAIDQRLGNPARRSGPLLQLAYAEVVAGAFAEAVGLAETAAAEARRYEQPRDLAMCLGGQALAHVHRGELDAADGCLAEARAAFPQMQTDPRGGRHLIAWPEAMLALERGDGAGVREAVAGLHSMSVKSLLGAAQIGDGDLDGARATLALLTDGDPPSAWASGLADRLAGRICLTTADTSDGGNGDGGTDRERGLELLERSAATLADLGVPFEAALSDLYAGTADRVRRALATFEALGASRQVEAARRTLRALGVRQPSRRSGRRADQPLSRRQMEVARLVAEGLTNAEVAERLFLSVRTVDSHLENIYGQLQISSRTSLARWIAELESRSG